MTQADRLRKKLDKMEDLFQQVRHKLLPHMRKIDDTRQVLDWLGWQPREETSKGLYDDLTLLEFSIMDALEAAENLSWFLERTREQLVQERRQ